MDGFEQKILVDGWVGRQNLKSSICIRPNTNYPPPPGQKLTQSLSEHPLNLNILDESNKRYLKFNETSQVLPNLPIKNLRIPILHSLQTITNSQTSISIYYFHRTNKTRVELQVFVSYKLANNKQHSSHISDVWRVC